MCEDYELEPTHLLPSPQENTYPVKISVLIGRTVNWFQTCERGGPETKYVLTR